MTDSEIIKALEICTNGKLGNEDCINCPYKDGIRPCFDCLKLDALDLIKRQNAEIQVLQTNNHSLCLTLSNRARVERAEAIKELAARLKEQVSHIPAWGAVAEKKIANLVKEMTEQ